MLEYIAIIGMMLALSTACSVIFSERRFSLNIFLTAIVMSMSVLIWKQMLPFWIIVFAAAIVVLMFFKKSQESGGKV